jgi:hypothetical protein
MFEKFRSIIGNIGEDEPVEQKSIKKEMENCERELRRVGFEMESFIGATSRNFNPSNDQKVADTHGKELERIMEKERELKERLEVLRQKLKGN